MRGVSVIRNVLAGGDIIEITHLDSDPLVWVVRRRRETFFGLKDISSRLFHHEAEAEAYAREGAGLPAGGPGVGLDFTA